MKDATNTSELVADAPPVPVNSGAGGYMDMIDKLSNNPTLQSVEIIERMMTMQERWEERNARKLFDESKARASQKIKHIKIVKTRSVAYDLEKGNKAAGQKEAFKFAPLEDIDKLIAPFLEEEKIDVSYKIEPCTIAGWHTVVCWLSHAGHREAYPMPMPLDTSGGKGNAQAMGSTQMYGMRRALCGAFNIIPIGMDDDGTGGPITTEQAAEIDVLIKQTGMNKEKFLAKYKVEDVRDIKTKDHQNALGSIYAYEGMKNMKAKKEKSNG